MLAIIEAKHSDFIRCIITEEYMYINMRARKLRNIRSRSRIIVIQNTALSFFISFSFKNNRGGSRDWNY